MMLASVLDRISGMSDDAALEAVKLLAGDILAIRVDELPSQIDQFDWNKTGDDHAVLRPALSTLSSMPPEDIAAFERTWGFVGIP